MPLPDSTGAYHDCIEIYDRASQDPTGCRVSFETFPEAKNFQLRMNYCRTLQRRDSSLVYPRESPKWNTSAYDRFMVKSPVEDTEGKWWVYIERRGLNILAVEGLSDAAETA